MKSIDTMSPPRDPGRCSSWTHESPPSLERKIDVASPATMTLFASDALTARRLLDVGLRYWLYQVEGPGWGPEEPPPPPFFEQPARTIAPRRRLPINLLFAATLVLHTCQDKKKIRKTVDVLDDDRRDRNLPRERHDLPLRPPAHRAGEVER